jgi:cyclohexanone monooxygenase
VAHIVRHTIETEVREVEVTAEAEAAWLDTLEGAARNLVAFQQSCTPGYYNNEGQPAAGGFLGTSYGHGPMAFFTLLDDWRTEGSFAGLDLRH